jgi:hypothetical protein
MPTAEEREQMRRWLEQWRVTGAILDAERWERVRRLTDDDAARDALRLWDMWQPDMPADRGEALLIHQRVFARGRT